MNVLLRKAKSSDIGIIQEFGSKLLNYERDNYDTSLDSNWAFSDEARQKYLDAIQNKYVIIAEMDGRPIGFLIASIIEPKTGDARQIKQAYLQNIYVEENYREAGVGKELVDSFKDYCRKEGVKRLNVSVLAANKNAAKFYDGIGFKPRSINLFQELTPS